MLRLCSQPPVMIWRDRWSFQYSKSSELLTYLWCKMSKTFVVLYTEHVFLLILPHADGQQPIPTIVTICSGIHCIEPSFCCANAFQPASKYDVAVRRASTVFPWVRLRLVVFVLLIRSDIQGVEVFLLSPTVSGDGSGERFCERSVSHCRLRLHIFATTVSFAYTFALKTQTNFLKSSFLPPFFVWNLS